MVRSKLAQLPVRRSYGVERTLADLQTDEAILQATKMSTLGLGQASTAPKRSSHDRREPSGGAYTMFTPQQVKQFKEAYNMIDQDGDGRVTEADLKIMLSNLGASSYILQRPCSMVYALKS